MTTIAIIGGGAAGLTAALAAARAGAQVTLYEASPRVGASILASGNGRCNISNAHIEAAVYRNAAFVSRAFEALPPCEVRSFFEGLGLALREELDGRLYPLTNKASSVLDVLRFALAEAGVATVCDLAVHTVTPAGATQLLTFSDGTAAFFDRAIVAVGGAVAQSMLPPRYPYEKTQPRLCPLKTAASQVKGLDNIRVRCRISLPARDFSEEGEVLFRKNGVSGIVVFNASRYASPGDTLQVDFLPGENEAETVRALMRRREACPERDGERLLAGLLLPAVARAVLRAAGVDAHAVSAPADLERLAHVLHAFELRVEGFDERTFQVHRGGFAVASFAPETMESKLDKGLFVVGEALDVDAPCGGYNLHWAWTGGLLAAKAAMR